MLKNSLTLALCAHSEHVIHKANSTNDVFAVSNSSYVQVVIKPLSFTDTVCLISFCAIGRKMLG